MPAQKSSPQLHTRARTAGTGGGRRSTLQILKDQSTISQPVGQIMPTTLLLVPLDLQTLLRPWS